MADDPALDLLNRALPALQDTFRRLPAKEEAYSEENLERMGAVLAEVTARMGDNFPYFHPLYAGQMLKPPHPVARAAYALAMWINPNNHALDGGRASSRMEVEAVREIARMYGWEQFLGHLTSSGTMANLEALWVAGKLSLGTSGVKRVLASDQAHYTHARVSAVLGLPFSSVASDERGRMAIDALESELRAGDVGTVVVTLGTTAAGAVDPLPQILALRERYEFRIHVDGAYGGYFVLAGNLAPEAADAFARIGEADSIVVDPHKHGLQPYGCGCVLFRDPSVGRFYKHDSPYTYFTSKDLHLGEITLECSRAGASAVALWATQRLLPLARGGEFAASLDQCRQAALHLYGRIKADTRFVVAFPPELDILVWAVRAPSVAAASKRAQEIFSRAAMQDLHLALVKLPARLFACWREDSDGAGRLVTCLRSVLMKPEHLAWSDRIWQRLSAAADAGPAGKGAPSPETRPGETGP